MPDERRLKAKEAKQKNSIKAMDRVIQFILNYDPERQQGEIPHRLERLEKIWETFEIVQSEYEELNDSEDFSAISEQIRVQMEEKYFEAKAALVSMLPLAAPVAPAYPAAAREAPGPNNVKLPTITLPEFDDFIRPKISLFEKKKESLKGEAASLIQSIAITANNYTVAWDTLVQRYSNKALLRKKYIRALLKYPKISNQSVDALHKIEDDFQRHTKILEQLGEPVEHFSSILMELLEDKLDDASLAAWEEFIATENQPTFNKMIEFLQRRARILETISVNRPHHNQVKSANQSSISKRPSNPRVSSNAAAEVSPKTYPLCPACEKQKHPLFDCSVFNNMDAKSRMKVVIEKKFCINCFRSDHFARSCRSKFTCKNCSKRHHSMIHPGPYELSSTIPEENAVKGSFTSRATNPGPSSVLTVSAVPTDSSPCVKTVLHPTSVLLTTVVLMVVDAYGQEHVARVMLDTGSQPNAISERLCQQLHLSRRSVNVPIAGVDGTVTNAKHEVSAEVRSRVSDFHEVLDFFGIAESYMRYSIRTVQVDMIIGAAHFYSFLRKGKFRIANLLFIETVFGWIASGKIESNREHSKQAIATCHVATVVPIDELLQRFWQLEDVSASNYSVDEQNCENFYQNTVSRDPSGRYIVRMPKHPDFNKMIGESKAIAMRRLSWLDKRLQKNEELKIQYHAFMNEYISLGHMVPVPDDDEAISIRCYLPHHPVINQSSLTTKVRVVFDGEN
ncbi:uncharacterized protein LOC129774548 [Toxorhynchites rutilus septentrionalis]|uniref:uncharacterized protein LOC129774548 n=1 Tax=Toxorhynchites rutilus septentrionalis TaxID=329112 RepID=UPI002479E558|nr:uncharacterized protein LOC129774548 [Toxorhynchites rutilus septentrionalis]